MQKIDVDGIIRKNAVLRIEPPPYKMIKTNKLLAKFEKTVYNICDCRKVDPAPCSAKNNCVNVATEVECDPNLCPAGERCHNQQFHRGAQKSFEVKLTKTKGWGLFAKEDIPINDFLIEYKGEIIDNAEMNQRFIQTTAHKDVNYYFMKLSNKLHIDGRTYGNEARFINHSCGPNTTPRKRNVYSKGQIQIRIGLFATRHIRMVTK